MHPRRARAKRNDERLGHSPPTVATKDVTIAAALSSRCLTARPLRKSALGERSKRFRDETLPVDDATEAVSDTAIAAAAAAEKLSPQRMHVAPLSDSALRRPSSGALEPVGELRDEDASKGERVSMGGGRTRNNLRLGFGSGGGTKASSPTPMPMLSMSGRNWAMPLAFSPVPSSTTGMMESSWSESTTGSAAARICTWCRDSTGFPSGPRREVIQHENIFFVLVLRSA